MIPGEIATRADLDAAVAEVLRQLPIIVQDAVRAALATKTEPLAPLRKILGCSAGAARARLFRLAQKGHTPESLGGVKVGREWYFRADVVTAWGAL